MHTKRIIPCLDVKAGRVVKGTNFVDLRDAGCPIELAQKYDEQLADELVFLDITASHEQRQTMLDVIKNTAGQVFMPLTVGGGLTSLEDIRAALKAGADKISLNSAAIKNPDLIKDGARSFGSQCIVVAVDAKQVAANKWEVFIKVAEVQNVTTAADELNISQSGVSYILKSLEKEIGFPLFTRHKRGVILTPNAEEILPAIHEFLNQKENI